MVRTRTKHKQMIQDRYTGLHPPQAAWLRLSRTRQRYAMQPETLWLHMHMLTSICCFTNRHRPILPPRLSRPLWKKVRTICNTRAHLAALTALKPWTIRRIPHLSPPYRNCCQMMRTISLSIIPRSTAIKNICTATATA